MSTENCFDQFRHEVSMQSMALHLFTADGNGSGFRAGPLIFRRPYLCAPPEEDEAQYLPPKRD
jgi:hypothetical protein